MWKQGSSIPVSIEPMASFTNSFRSPPLRSTVRADSRWQISPPFSVFIGEGRVDLSNEDFQWSGAKVEFGNSSLLMGGSWKREGASEITAKGKADLKNLLALSQSPLFPKETRLKIENIKSLSGAGH